MVTFRDSAASVNHPEAVRLDEAGGAAHGPGVIEMDKGRRGGAAGNGRRDPERTRAQILEAAIGEFAAKGLGGARVNEIAARAGANKRMLYHYFGNKEELYLAALEKVYADIRREEQALSLGDLEPEEGMHRLLAFTWSYFHRHPEFIHMLNCENQQQARHLARSTRIRELHSPLVRMIEDLLERGAEKGVFRAGVDPIQLYISIAALGYFYLSNRHTLSTIFAIDLGSDAAREARQAHLIEVVMGYLRP